MIIDVHAHLDMFNEEELKELIYRAKFGKVKTIITNSINMKSILNSLKISKQYPEIVKLAVGLYPEKEIEKENFKDFEKFVVEHKNEISAFGEIGLDLYYTNENFDIQKFIFIRELELAQKLNYPVIIHSRKAEKEVLEIIEKFSKLKIVLHCFSGNFNLVRKGIELGCYFSIPANIVRSEHFQKIVREIPKDKILTETDSPYLSPFKDKENEPSFIKESIKVISKIWGFSEEETETQIEKNFEKVFKK